jgi:hypothetical protein
MVVPIAGDGYYQGAIPLELLHQEQQRIVGEPFATLTTPDLARALDSHEHDSRQAAKARTATAASNGHGSNKGQVVALTGRYLNHETVEAIGRLHGTLCPTARGKRFGVPLPRGV